MALPPPPLNPCLSPLWSFDARPSPGSQSHSSKSCRAHCASYLSSVYQSMILMFLFQKGTTLPSLPRPQNATKVPSLQLLRVRVTQPVSPFVMQRSSPPLVLPSRVTSSSRQQISTFSRLSPLIPTRLLRPRQPNSRADAKERPLLQTLADLTVCDVYDAHIALAHFLDPIRVRPSRLIPRLRNVMRAWFPPLQGKEIQRD